MALLAVSGNAQKVNKGCTRDGRTNIAELTRHEGDEPVRHQRETLGEESKYNLLPESEASIGYVAFLADMRPL